MRWPSATTDAAATSVEQRDLNSVPSARLDDALLGAIEIPSRREPADVLCRVRVADHHFLPAVDPRAVPGNRQQPVENTAGILEVARRFEQRHDA
jgi:hypothetical protein